MLELYKKRFTYVQTSNMIFVKAYVLLVVLQDQLL